MIAEAQALVLVAALLLSSSGLAVVIPWLARRLTVHVLRELRERLYRLGTTPGFRETLVYRDTEFVMCTAIYLARDGTPAAVSSFTDSLLRSRHEISGRSAERAEAYRREIAEYGSGADGVLELHGHLAMVFAGFAVLRRPWAMMVIAALIPVVAVVVLVLAIRQRGGPVQRLARTVDSARQFSSFTLAGAS